VTAADRDDPWRRLPWLLPAALLLSLLSLAIFLRLLSGPPMAPAPPPIEITVIEEPPAPPVAAAPPPDVALPPPRPEPPPPEPPPEPAPVPQAQPVPPPLPPPPATPRPPRPPPAVPTPPAAAPSPPRPAATPAPAPSPGGGNMGARAIYRPLPEIPEALRRRAVELVAVARFRVAADGSAEVELIEPTPDPGLNRTLLETLKKWRFFPAMEDGKPIASSIDIRIPISVR
jgi:protein TonB